MNDQCAQLTSGRYNFQGTPTTQGEKCAASADSQIVSMPQMRGAENVEGSILTPRLLELQLITSTVCT